MTPVEKTILWYLRFKPLEDPFNVDDILVGLDYKFPRQEVGPALRSLADHGYFRKLGVGVYVIPKKYSMFDALKS